MRKRILYSLSDGWVSAIERGDELMSSPCFEAVKDEARIRAGFVRIGDRPAFLKRFDSGSWKEGLIDRVRGSRARRSLRGAALLERGGFSRPAPLAAMELRRLGSVRASYLLSEALMRARTLSAFVDRGVDPRRRDPRWRAGVIGAVANEIGRLHGAGLYSSDLQETNLMLEERSEGGLRIYFVDLDGFCRIQPLPWRRRLRNLVQLDRSVGRFMNRAERLKFLYAYLGGRPPRGEARRIVGRLLQERRRKDREYARRRARRRESAGPPARAGAANLRSSTPG